MRNSDSILWRGLYGGNSGVDNRLNIIATAVGTARETHEIFTMLYLPKDLRPTALEQKWNLQTSYDAGLEYVAKTFGKLKSVRFSMEAQRLVEDPAVSIETFEREIEHILFKNT